MSVACARPSLAGCGNGIVEPSEECDPGGALHIEGNPSEAICTTGDTCFYVATCCKFNCQAVGPGVQVSCFDGNECTDNDVCNQVGACVGTAAANKACDDGLFCTDVDTCNASGTCIGVGDPCAGGAECADSCNEAADSCNDPNGTPCGNPSDTVCDNPDTCNGSGSCLPNYEPDTTVCRADAGDCDIPEYCNGSGSCPSNGFEAAGSTCGDPSDNECTNPDTCNGSGTCLANNAANGSSCGDQGVTCHVDDTCQSGVCQDNGYATPGSACGDPSDTECTDPDTCSPIGTCLANDAANGSSCGDEGVDCLVDDTCQSGACQDNGFEAVGSACGDPSDTFCANPDTCDGLGTCLGNDEAAGTPCGDLTDDDCRNPDVCDESGQCSGADEPVGTPCGSPIVNDCTQPDTCDADGNCSANHVPAGTPCGDSTADNCTAPDTCSGSGECDANHALDGQPCDDDNACTSDSACISGACVAGSEVVCDEGGPCEYAYCDFVSGGCVYEDEPRPDCTPTVDAQIKLANKAVDTSDKLKWLWKRDPVHLPEGLPAESLGDPIKLTEYTLCIFDGRAGDSTLVAQLAVPASALWEEKKSGFYKYTDRSLMSDGLFRGALRSGVKGAAGFAARGEKLTLPAPASGESYFEMAPSLTTQLVNSEGACWIADFNAAKVNTGDKFKTTRKAIVIPH